MSPERSASSSSAAVTVVVVDDDEQMRTLVGRILKAEGYDVHAVDSSESALRVIERVEKIDVLLTDVAMPEGPGSDLAAEVRRTHPGTRIIYMSSYSPDELLSYGVDAVGSPFLSKPFLPSELLAKLREILGS